MVYTPIFVAAAKQLYEWFILSICLSVCLSIYLSHVLHYVPIIVSSWKFQELLPMTEMMSMQKVKVTEVKTQFSRLRTVTPVWIHIWWWNDAQSVMLLRRCALSSSVKYQDDTAKKIFFPFDPNWVFPGCMSSLNLPMATKWCTKFEIT